MTRRRFTALVCAALIAMVSTLASAALAGAVPHTLRLSIYQPGATSAAKLVYFDMKGLDPALSTQITVRRPGVITPIEDEFEFSGPESLSTYDLDLLEPGDLIELRQPSAAPTPVQTFQTPSATLNFGGTTISGTLGAGAVNTLSIDGTCLSEESVVALPASGGPFIEAFSAAALPPGARVSLRSINSRGFQFGYNTLAPGERPCVFADGSAGQSLSANPGGKDPTPYRLQVEGLSQLIPNTRIVLRRGGTIVEDRSLASSQTFAVLVASAPRPGDQIELYRPQTAGAPSQVVTIPQISGKFDPAVDLAAIDGPAGREVRVYACQPQICGGSGRTLLDTPVGRSFYDFAKSDSNEIALDLQADSVVEGTFQSATDPIQYRFRMPSGDLVAPKQTLKLPAKLKRSSLARAFKKGFRVKVKSDEAGPATLTLVFPKVKAGRAVTLAKASNTVSAGTTTVKLKFTRPGKKALKKLRKRSSRLATLTSTVTDASGNASTLVKRTKIKA